MSRSAGYCDYSLVAVLGHRGVVNDSLLLPSPMGEASYRGEEDRYFRKGENVLKKVSEVSARKNNLILS